MNRQTINAIMKFSVTVMLLSVFLFFLIDKDAFSFVPVCISMFFCSLVFTLCVIYLRFFNEDRLDKKPFAISLAVWYGIVAVSAVIKFVFLG